MNDSGLPSNGGDKSQTNLNSDNFSTVSNLNNPPSAMDDDLIEKEWVDRAKKIVEETKTDPAKQKNAIDELGLDYKKKRNINGSGSV